MTKEKIRVVLIDDEQDAIEVMTSLLERLFPDLIEITGTANSVSEAVEKVKDLKPQLLFLDIQLSDGTGLGFLKMFDELPFEVIFVTGFDRYAINAIRLSALDYLLKPVEVGDLINAVAKAEQVIAEKKKSQGLLENLLGNMDQQEKDRRIAVHKGEMVHYLVLSDIISLEATGNYTTIETFDGKDYITTHNLKTLEEMFGSNSAFVRVSRSFILNTNFIHSYSKNEPYYIHYANGKSTEISRRKRQQVIEKLKEKI